LKEKEEMSRLEGELFEVRCEDSEMMARPWIVVDKKLGGGFDAMNGHEMAVRAARALDDSVGETT